MDEFCFASSESASKGMIIGWGSNMFRGKIIHVGDVCLTMEFIKIVDQFSWLCTLVYSPDERHLKPDF